MSSTNSTSNYSLSQFIGSDKPAWLSDYNGDMSKIDTQMKANADAATAASGSATSANTAIGTLSSLSTTDKTSLVAAINEVNTNLGTTSGVASGASTTATAADGKADAALAGLAKFDLTANELTVSVNKGVLDSSSHLYIAKDSTNSVFKLYGFIAIKSLEGQTGNLTITISSTSLNPSTAYTIKSAGIRMTAYTSGNEFTSAEDITIGTNGVPTITNTPVVLDGITTDIKIQLMPCLYFNKNFGDQ